MNLMLIDESKVIQSFRDNITIDGTRKFYAKVDGQELELTGLRLESYESQNSGYWLSHQLTFSCDKIFSIIDADEFMNSKKPKIKPPSEYRWLNPRISPSTNDLLNE